MRDFGKYDLTSFRKDLEELHISLTEEQEEKFLIFYELLVEWNQVMNLTAITDFEEVIKKHFVDSLSLVRAIPDFQKGIPFGKSLSSGSVTLIDVGTGAGFPGIPLKIAFPELEITLLDSLQKRVNFLNTVIQELSLKGISAVHGRAEDFARPGKLREQFDYCVSRAVANLSTLSEYCIPFVKVGGYFISYKSGGAEEEAALARAAVRILGGDKPEAVSFFLPGTDMKRMFFVIRKKAPTPVRYPRKAGLPAKEPIHS